MFSYYCVLLIYDLLFWLFGSLLMCTCLTLMVIIFILLAFSLKGTVETWQDKRGERGGMTCIKGPPSCTYIASIPMQATTMPLMGTILKSQPCNCSPQWLTAFNLFDFNLCCTLQYNTDCRSSHKVMRSFTGLTTFIHSGVAIFH